MKKSESKSATATLITLLLISACATNTSSNNSSQGEDPNYDKNGKAKAITVTQTPRGVQITSDERVLFDTGKADVKADGAVYVARVATILQTKTSANVAIEGHTDNVGGSALNQQLSARRANSVKEALVKKGVPATRIQTQGFGMSKPVSDNTTPEGRQANRRTDIIVLGETEANISGPAGSPGLADQLSVGLDKFLKNAGEFIKNVFGGGSS